MIVIQLTPQMKQRRQNALAEMQAIRDQMNVLDTRMLTIRQMARKELGIPENMWNVKLSDDGNYLTCEDNNQPCGNL